MGPRPLDARAGEHGRARRPTPTAGLAGAGLVPGAAQAARACTTFASADERPELSRRAAGLTWAFLTRLSGRPSCAGARTWTDPDAARADRGSASVVDDLLAGRP